MKSPWSRALRCMAVTFQAKSLMGIMRINERGINLMYNTDIRSQKTMTNKSTSCTCITSVAGTAGPLVVRRRGVFMALCRVEVTLALHAVRTLHYRYHHDG